jgi:hypothetical protein
MPTIRVKAQISAQELIDAAGQLDGPELEAVSDRLLVMRAERRAPHLSYEETEMLLKINTPLPEETWRRYTSLYAKLDPDTITAEEHAELLQLINVVEMDNARRIGHLIELARLRRTSLDTLMKSLGIGPRSHA